MDKVSKINKGIDINLGRIDGPKSSCPNIQELGLLRGILVRQQTMLNDLDSALSKLESLLDCNRCTRHD